MKYKKSLVIFIFLALTGCALQPKIIGNNIDTEYKKKISGLSIIYLAKKIGVDEQYIKRDEFEKLAIAFTNARIKTDLFFYSSLDLNNEAHLDALQKKNPYLLIIDPIAMTTGDTSNITYNLALYDVPVNKKIWVANLWVPNGWIKSIFQRYDEMGDLVVEKLVSGGLVDGAR
jgi:hypothetical protein